MVADGTDLPALPNPLSDYLPTARPGSHAPHVWLERNGERLSTIDLFDRGFTLLTGPNGHAWRDAGSLVSRRLRIPLHSYRVGEHGDVRDTHQGWATTYGVGRDGAVLVRPDGYVAWRSPRGTQKPVIELEGILKTMLAHELV